MGHGWPGELGPKSWLSLLLRLLLGLLLGLLLILARLLGLLGPSLGLLVLQRGFPPLRLWWCPLEGPASDYWVRCG